MPHEAHADTPAPRFSEVLLEVLRTRLRKQVALAQRVECSEAAVSFWEAGRRIPSRRMFVKILDALHEAGATSSELLLLTSTWKGALLSRSALP